MIRKFAVLAVAVILSGSAFATEWDVDAAHSMVGFSVKHMMVTNVHGAFNRYTAKVNFDEAKPEALQVEATIDASSIDTRIQKRDEHLRSADFFDVLKFPNITFKSKKAEVIGKGEYKVTGDMTMHGVTKEVVLKGTGFTTIVKDPWGNTRTSVNASATINRKDFGLNQTTAMEGGVVVSDEVVITLELELTKK